MSILLVSREPLKEPNFLHLQKHLDSKLRHKYFRLDFITTLEVKHIIDNLNCSKATGVDGIGPKLIKMTSDHICVALTSLINNSIETGIFPNKLKIARVIPIFKKGSTENPSNYRPISILNTISKIFERHVANQMHEFMKETNIIHQTQSGFRKEHSCLTALTYMTDSWMKSIDNGEIVGCVLLDLQKAFDLVDHEILLYKLKLYHFSETTLAWFKSYLNGRYQHVQHNNEKSNELEIKTGVPQGSILGPLLFLLYVNDLPMAIHKSSLDMYADDSTLYTSGRNFSVIEQSLQEDTNNISNWCKINNMAINANKTKCMVVGSKTKVKSNKNLTLSVNNELIENVTNQKILGVNVDNTLEWHLQIKDVCARVNSKLYMFKIISKHLSGNMKVLFYNSYILPVLDYCNTIWGSCNQTQIYKLSKLQKRAARIILNKSFHTPSAIMFNELSWLSMSNRFKYHMGILVYKALNNIGPSYFCNLVTKSGNHSYQLRSVTHGDLVIAAKPNTLYLKRTFGYCGMNIWNKIPLDIRCKPSLSKFKTALYSYFLVASNTSI